jgi:hypothetical protein
MAGTLPTDPIERCKLLEQQVADLTDRVKALEDGRNLDQKPKFKEGTADAPAEPEPAWRRESRASAARIAARRT